MRLSSGDVLFELRIVGYEFLDGTDGSLNWLLIEGTVRHPHGNWVFRHPSLARLVPFRRASRGRGERGEQEFPYLVG